MVALSAGLSVSLGRDFEVLGWGKMGRIRRKKIYILTTELLAIANIQ